MKVSYIPRRGAEQGVVKHRAEPTYGVCLSFGIPLEERNMIIGIKLSLRINCNLDLGCHLVSLSYIIVFYSAYCLHVLQIVTGLLKMGGKWLPTTCDVNIIWLPRTERSFYFLFLFCEKVQGKSMMYCIQSPNTASQTAKLWWGWG